MKNLLLPVLLGLASVASALAQTAQVRSVPTFHAIKVGSGVSLLLTAGHAQRVEVSADNPALRDRLLTTVVAGVLTISYDDPHSIHLNQRNAKLRVAVTADQLTALSAGSGSAVQAHGNIAASAFQLNVASGASLQADIDTQTLSVNQSSGSSVSLSGHAPSLELQAGSGATFSGKNLQTDHCRAQASSGSSVQLAVKEDLIADASSGASISYVGSPKVTKRVSSGASVSGR